jgi:hypothetical protein
MVDSGLIDPLRNFSEACREEFQLRTSPSMSDAELPLSLGGLASRPLF